MNKLKITTNVANNRIASVVINGEEISYKISGLTLEMKGGEYPRALIEVPLSEIEVEGEFDVLKKIPEERDNKEIISFSIGDIKTEICSEYIIKEIGKKLEKELIKISKS